MSPDDRPGSPLGPGRVLVLTSVMLAFIGTWRTAAVVLCDLASTAYYIGGIVESQIGKAAPWFILAVMVFSYAVRSVYIESCSMFVRGGVYRVVKEAMGQGMAKLSVSALMFDYVLTGPISGVSAGQYLVRLLNAILKHFHYHHALSERWGAAGIAVAVVLYFFQANVRGIPTSAAKAVVIMKATTVMAVIVIAWCLLTIAIRPEARALPPAAPDLSRKVDRDGKPDLDEITGRQKDPLGWLGAAPVARELRDPAGVHWLGLVGALGVLAAFGHSILAMSGEETLAQVYREVKAPKLRNFKRAAFIVFLYSFLLTGLVSLFAVMIIPDSARPQYLDNLISGLAMHVVGPTWARLALNALVVIVGFLILAGSVNTSIVGSNGVLNRVAEDGVLSDWFLKPAKSFGTTWRLLTLIAGLQIATIVLSGGNVLLLGEAYAFGVVWSLVFKALAMVVLRLKEPGRYRGYRVPLNVRIGRREVPVGLALIALVLLAAALANLLTKPVATISGLIFAATFFATFTVSERLRKGADHDADAATGGEHRHLEEFEVAYPDHPDAAGLGLKLAHRIVVEVGPPADDPAGLERCLIEADPDTTEILAVAAHPPTTSGPYGDPAHSDIAVAMPGTPPGPEPPLGDADRKVMTHVVHRAETAGKPVRPMVLLVDDPPAALVALARLVGAQELILAPPDSGPASALLDRAAGLWGEAPLTLRVIGKGLDERREIAGGGRVPPAPDDGGETARALAGASTD